MSEIINFNGENSKLEENKKENDIAEKNEENKKENDNTEENEEIKKRKEYAQKVQEKIKERNEKMKENIINLVMRQTIYTREEAIDLLVKYNYDYQKVIKYYLKPESINPISNDSKKVNINQQKYTEIRHFMDNVVKKYNQKKQYEEYIEKLKQEKLKLETDVSNSLLSTIPEESSPKN